MQLFGLKRLKSGKEEQRGEAENRGEGRFREGGDESN